MPFAIHVWSVGFANIHISLDAGVTASLGGCGNYPKKKTCFFHAGDLQRSWFLHICLHVFLHWKFLLGSLKGKNLSYPLAHVECRRVHVQGNSLAMKAAIGVIVFVQSWNLRFKQWLASTLSHLRCEHWSKLKGKSTHTGSFNKQRFLYSDFLLLKGWPLNPPGTGRNASKDLLCQRLDEVSLNLNLAKKALIP